MSNYISLRAVISTLLLVAAGVNCFADVPAGRWTSNFFTFSSDKDSQSEIKMNCDMQLSQDHYAYMVFNIYITKDNSGSLETTEAKCSFPGIWEDKGGLLIQPNPRLFKSDSKDVSLAMLSGDSGVVSINDLKARGMIITKNADNTGAAFSYFKPTDNEAVPMVGLMRGVCYDPVAESIIIGLFLRDGEDTPFFTNTYKLTGELLDSRDTDLLSEEEKENELKKSKAYHDTEICPIEGQSRYTFSDGSVYDGLWANKAPSGSGKLTMPGGYWKDGVWEAGAFVGGKGRIMLDDASTYEGDVVGDYPDGKGTKRDSLGTYSGIWSKGVIVSGTADIKYDGNQYKGGWSNNSPSGKGRLEMTDGCWKEGTWAHGVLADGNGAIVLEEGAAYEGSIKNDLPDGEGTMTTETGRYTGTWSKGVLERGLADLTPEEGCKFKCEVAGGCLTGKGKMVKKGGSYEGTWENGEFRQGKIWKSGAYMYEGTFADSTFVEGKCTFENVNSMSGKWKEMKLQEGSVFVRTGDDSYPRFKGTIEDGVLTSGSFTSKADFNIASNWSERTSSDKLEITFSNGDKAKGIWDVETGLLVEASTFDYIWADGVKCTWLVGKKAKLGKPVYTSAAGEPAKASIARGRVIMNTDGKEYTLTPIRLDAVNAAIGGKILLP